MTQQPIVYAAAAGSGKTTQLVCEYLKLLDFCDPSEIIAITFTRAAGAELLERVGLALRAGLGEATCQEKLGKAWPKYQEALPDEATQRRALRGLFDAPVGTTDSFIQMLLGEFGLDAELPIDGSHVEPLDVPVGLGETGAVFEAAARDVIDPLEGPMPGAAVRALVHVSLADLVSEVAKRAEEPVREKLLTATELFEIVRPLAGAALRQTLSDGKNPGPAAGLEEAAKAWFDAGAVDPVSAPCVAYTALRAAHGRTKKPTIGSKALADAVAELPAVDLAVVQMSAADLIDVFAKWPTEQSIHWADELRADIADLAALTRANALTLCARNNALNYQLLIEAAIHLCQPPSERLRTRFKALLVDEAQDANPEQMRLYQALTELPGNGKRLTAIYVGDVRQSIYLFRGAEPQIFVDLQQAPGVEVRALDINRRATPSLVKSQRALFVATSGLTEDASELRIVGLQQPIDRVEWDEERAEDELGEAQSPRQPIVLVHDKDNPLSTGDTLAVAIDHFVTRVTTAWKTERNKKGEIRTGDTAVVLAPSWNKARQARDRLQALLGGSDKAFLDGSRELAKTNTVRDLTTLLRALWDPTDQVASAAVWKLPFVGLTDGALAVLALTKSLKWQDEVVQGLNRALWADRTVPGALSATDEAAFLRAQPVLAQAARRIGREPTADVLEFVTTALHWRTVLLASPERDDAVAHLEVALDWIRSAEQGGVDPDVALATLNPEGGDENAPRVHIQRPSGTVTCTTIFQAKGLQWDHVCLIDPGVTPSGSDGGEFLKVDGEPRRLWGVKLDPARTIAPVEDPIALLTGKVAHVRKQLERLRTTYVAITRAKRSVTMGFGNCGGIHQELATLWLGLQDPGIFVIDTAQPKRVQMQRSAWVHTAGALTERGKLMTGWRIETPSQAERNLTPGERREIALRVAEVALPKVKLGKDRPHMPPVVVNWEDTERGNIVHGWMATHGLDRNATAADAHAYLQTRWKVEEPEAAAWLHATSKDLPERQPWLYDLLTDPANRRYHEVPMLGVTGDRLLNGRIDVLVEKPDGKWWVIDWKGSNWVRNGSVEDLIGSANLTAYGPQLEGYRLALEAQGKVVEGVGLAFAGSWSWVGW